MLSLVEVSRASRVLETRIVGHRLQAAVQPDAMTLVLEFYGPLPGGGGERSAVVLSGNPNSGRIGLRERLPGGGGPPPALAQFARAHLVGARVASVRQLGGDREVAIRLRTKAADFDLLLSLFGRRSNVYVISSDDRILAALRPLAETRHDLSLGGAWQSPSSPPRTDGSDRFEAFDDASLLHAIESHYAEAEEASAQSDRSRRIEQVLRKESKSLDRKIAKLEAELEAAEKAVHLERHGELLKSVLASVSKGDRETTVVDWDTGESVRIALDTTLAPAENLDRLFKRYRKALRTLTKGGAQLAAVRSSRDRLAELESGFSSCVDEDAIAAFEARSEVTKLLGKSVRQRPPSRKGGKPQRVKLAGREVDLKFVPRRYRTESGLEVWVGKSDAANDFLTVKLARGRDLFFHVDGAPGSHVILRTEGRDDPPSEAVLDACELAVHFSKQKNAGRADVHVVPIQNVRKPKGAKPGLVSVHGGKSLHLRRASARLERILAAKVDD